MHGIITIKPIVTVIILLKKSDLIWKKNKNGNKKALTIKIWMQSVT